MTRTEHIREAERLLGEARLFSKTPALMRDDIVSLCALAEAHAAIARAMRDDDDRD